jgi:hypothetical protein
MRKAVLAIVISLIAPAAIAAEWVFENTDLPVAYFDNGAAQFQFACRSDLAMMFWVREPHGSVAKATSMHLAITPDPAKGPASSSLEDASFAQDIPLIHGGGAWVMVRGPVAKSWARIAQNAAHTIRIAYVRKDGELTVFDSNDFGAKGSSAAIGKVLDHCG